MDMALIIKLARVTTVNDTTLLLQELYLNATPEQQKKILEMIQRLDTMAGGF